MISSMEHPSALANCCTVFAVQRAMLLRPAQMSMIVVFGTPLILER